SEADEISSERVNKVRLERPAWEGFPAPRVFREIGGDGGETRGIPWLSSTIGGTTVGGITPSDSTLAARPSATDQVFVSNWNNSEKHYGRDWDRTSDLIVANDARKTSSRLSASQNEIAQWQCSKGNQKTILPLVGKSAEFALTFPNSLE